MTPGNEAFRHIQSAARSAAAKTGTGAPTQEYLIRHTLNARYRGVTLEPIAPYVVGYGQVGQAKWAAWRRKERLEAACEADLDQQMALVASYLDPVFSHGGTPPPRTQRASAPRSVGA